MTLEERLYTEVFDKTPNLRSEVLDISAINSIYFMLSINGCSDQNHDFGWKMYTDDIGIGPISLACWSETSNNLKYNSQFNGTFSKDTNTVLHSMNRVLKDIPKDVDPRKALIGMAGYRYISQNKRLTPSAIKLNFDMKMPELTGMCDFCREVSDTLDSKIRVLNTQRDKTL